MQPRARRLRSQKRFIRILDSWLFLLGAAAVFVFLGVAVGKEAWRSYQVNSDLRQLEKEISDLQQQNNQLGDLVTYLNSPEYQETAAKDKLGLKKPGERVVNLPDVQVADTAGAEGAAGQAAGEDASEAAKPNVLKWWDYYFAPKKLSNNS